MLISVVIPCYNVEAYVEESIASALGQTYSNLEIICIDDGSTDGTLSILRQLEAQHPVRIRVHSGANRGAPAARNRGLAAAKGEYIQFLDADDLLLPTKIEHQVAMIEATGIPPDLLAASLKVRLLDGSIEIRAVETLDPWISLARGRLGITSANLWKKSSVQCIGGFDEKLKSSQDTDLMFRLLTAGARIVFDPECLTIVRKRPGSITTSVEPVADKIERHMLVRQRMLEYVRQSGEASPERERALYQDLFEKLSLMYQTSPADARQLHREWIPNQFVPVTRGGVYERIYGLMGFRIAEELRHYWGVARQKYRLPSLRRIARK